eukprot:scaffold417890_cov40-Prasinocladus_malaysianus.AAC.3
MYCHSRACDPPVLGRGGPRVLEGFSALGGPEGPLSASLLGTEAGPGAGMEVGFLASALGSPIRCCLGSASRPRGPSGGAGRRPRSSLGTRRNAPDGLRSSGKVGRMASGRRTREGSLGTGGNREGRSRPGMGPYGPQKSSRSWEERGPLGGYPVEKIPNRVSNESFGKKGTGPHSADCNATSSQTQKRDVQIIKARATHLDRVA